MERYERRSLIISSNLVFSEWNRIFKSLRTTAAAIDRLVHHAAIIEIDRDSVRAEEAKKRNPKKTNDEPDCATTTTTQRLDDNYSNADDNLRRSNKDRGMTEQPGGDRQF